MSFLHKPAAHLPGGGCDCTAVRTALTERRHGLAVPNGFATTVYVQFGTAPPLFGVTPPQKIGAGDGIVGVNATLTGLRPSTAYLFQLVMTNANGTSSGYTAVFTTTS
jgi:hypothetical protein